MQFYDAEARGLHDFSAYTLLVPVISVGTVGPLAADLLISTLELARQGVLSHDAILSCVGQAAFSHMPGLTFGLELFCDHGRKLACLQQRSPAAPGLQVELAEAMAAWIAKLRFKQVWVLGSLDAVFRRDSQLAGPQLRYWSRDAALGSACSSQGLQPLEEDWFEGKPVEQRRLPPWPLLLACERAGVPAAALLTFSLEGDNLPDAFSLAGVAARAVGLVGSGGEAAGTTSSNNGGGLQWRPPSSWRYALGRADDRPVVY